MATLAEWEKRLTPFFNKNIRIIGEIPLSEADLDEILDLVRDEIQETNTSDTTDKLIKLFPHTFLVMLAHFAAYNDNQGYWNKLNERLSTTQTHGYWWHQKFVKLAKQYGLFTFSKKDMRNYYVATVRFHGGIPTYSLPDFFDQMVIPAITRPGYREVPPKDLLPNLIKQVYFVDKPVLDFLENSGEMGKTWFEACCNLARHAKQNYGEVLPKEAVSDLPLYIYQFFEKYNEGLVGTRYHWRRPYLSVAPYSEDTAVTLNLPQQAVPLEMYARGLTWQITWPELKEPVLISCKMKRLRQDAVAGEVYFPIQATIKSLTVSIFSDGTESDSKEEFRRWTLPLLSTGALPPILAFREDRTHISNPQTLPAKPLYFLLPKDFSIAVEGSGSKTGTFRELFDAWSNWKIESWDLTDALSISLVKDDFSLWESIPIAREMAQPGLTGGHLSDYQEIPDQPLYTSGLPLIKIPVRSGINKQQALSGWKMHVFSLWETQPDIDQTITLLNVSDRVVIEGNYALLPLSDVLGDKAAGIYDIKISGPRGLSSEHRIRLWPKLLVKDLSLAFPDSKTAHEDIQFEVRLQEGAYLENQAGAENVDIVTVDGAYLINVPPEVFRVRLDLIAEKTDQKLVRVPISIPIPRLRWALAEEKIPGDLPFGQKLINLSMSRFEQYQSSALHIQMYGLEEKIHQLKVHLVENGDADDVKQEAKLFSSGFAKDWLRVSLRPFSDTIQQANSVVQFELVYRKDWVSEPLRYPLLSITPQLVIQNVKLQPVTSTSWRFSWEAEKPLINRRIMIRSLWQPWQDPIESKIPDDVIGEFVIKDVALPPCYYEVYFYVLNDWAPKQEKPPEGIQPHIIKLCSAEDRLEALKEVSGEHDEAFMAAFEKACVFDSLGDSQERDIAVSEAAKHLRHLDDIKILVGSINWMQNKDITPSYKSFFLNNLFFPELLETLLSKYKPTDPVLQEYLRLTATVNSIHLKSAKKLIGVSDNPIVMSACLNILIKRKDQELLSILISLMEDGRLSKDDAVSYLLKMEKDYSLVLNEFEQLLWSSYTDALLTDYLDAIFDKIKEESSHTIKHAMYRAAHYEKSEQRIYQYIEYLIKSKWNIADVYELLINRHLAGMLNDKQFKVLISIQPKDALPVLQDTSVSYPEYADFVAYLEMTYPEACCLLRPGLSLKTPFGIAKIEKIRDREGNLLDKAKMRSADFILEMTESEGLDKIRVKVDFIKNEIIFDGKDRPFRCVKCNYFVHPDQNKLRIHNQNAHGNRSLSFKKVGLPILFTKDDIQFIDTNEEPIEE